MSSSGKRTLEKKEEHQLKKAKIVQNDTTTINLRPEVVAINKKLIKQRRSFHMTPELSFKEFRTSEWITNCLHSYGMDVKAMGGTGVIGILKGDKDGPCIALRADMDGLPIQEENDVEYKSGTENVMHACGHDAHMAMLLYAAKILSKQKTNIAGTVKFIFQPAEERGGGAKVLVNEGVLQNPVVDEVYGLHVWNYQSSCTVGVKMGPLMASSDAFECTITGIGGHGANPQGTRDSLLAGCEWVAQANTIISRNLSPLDSGVVTVGKFESGYGYATIADKAHIMGTFRSFDDKVRDIIVRRLKEISEGVGKSFDVQVDLDLRPGYPSTINKTQTAVDNVRSAAQKIVGKEMVIIPDSTMAAEDMSYYLREIPGCFFFLGSCPSDPNGSEKKKHAHHQPEFDIDEKCLAVGASIWVQLVEDLLIKK